MTADHLLRFGILIDFHFMAKRLGFKKLHVDYERWIAKAPINDVMSLREKRCGDLRAEPLC